jgi:heptosyltransferase-2
MPRILIVAPSWIGDTLLAQPLFARLHEKHSGLALDALAPAWTKPVLDRMPEIAETIVSPFAHGELRLGDRYRLGKSLRERRYDEAIILPNTLKSALVPFFANVPVRTGFIGEGRRGLLNRSHRLDRKALPLMAERYAQLAETPGEPVQRPLPRVHLAVNEANRDAAMTHFGLDRSRPVAVFAPGAEFGPAKRWPARHFAALAKVLGARGFAVWLVGSAKERALGDEIAAGADGAARNLCGAMDLASAIDVMSAASVVVSNDSGTMHIAAALGRPLVALYGSSSPEHTPPLGPARIARIQIECSPCFKRECPLKHFKCMIDLTPAQVLVEVEQALG